MNRKNVHAFWWKAVARSFPVWRAKRNSLCRCDGEGTHRGAGDAEGAQELSAACFIWAKRL